MASSKTNLMRIHGIENELCPKFTDLQSMYEKSIKRICSNECMLRLLVFIFPSMEHEEQKVCL